MAKKETPMMIVNSKMKEFVKSSGMASSGDLAEALNESVAVVLKNAVSRTKTNGRSTVRAGDL